MNKGGRGMTIIDDTVKFLRNREEIVEIDKRLTKLHSENSALESKLINYVVENKLYSPINKLKEYEGYDVEEITLVLENGEVKDFWGDEIMCIRDGHFYYSSYDYGIYEFDEDTMLYYEYFRYKKSEGDKVIGYFDLVINDSIKDTMLDDILKGVLNEC